MLHGTFKHIQIYITYTGVAEIRHMYSKNTFVFCYWGVSE